jgi:hypothetical protein
MVVATTVGYSGVSFGIPYAEKQGIQPSVSGKLLVIIGISPLKEGLDRFGSPNRQTMTDQLQCDRRPFLMRTADELLARN